MTVRVVQKILLRVTTLELWLGSVGRERCIMRVGQIRWRKDKESSVEVNRSVQVIFLAWRKGVPAFDLYQMLNLQTLWYMFEGTTHLRCAFHEIFIWDRALYFGIEGALQVRYCIGQCCTSIVKYTI